MADVPQPAVLRGLEAAPEDLARFRQFVNWLTLAVVVFTVLQLLGGLIFHQVWLGAAGGLCLGYGLCLFWARQMLRRGRLHAAVILTAVGLLALILGGAPVLPFLYPTLILLPFVAVAPAPPPAHRRELRCLIPAAWLVGRALAPAAPPAP